MKVFLSIAISLIVACCTACDSDKQKVEQYLSEHHPGASVEVTDARNLGMVYSPFEMLNSVYMKSADVYSECTKRVSDAYNLKTRKERVAEMDAIIAELLDWYENALPENMGDLIKYPQSSVDDEHPANREAIYAEYSIDGRFGSGTFYLNYSGKDIGHTDKDLTKRAVDIITTLTDIYTFANDLKEIKKFL